MISIEERVLELRDQLDATAPEDHAAIMARIYDLDGEIRQRLPPATADAVAELEKLGASILFIATVREPDAVGTSISWHGGNEGLGLLSMLPRLIRFEASELGDFGASVIGTLGSLRYLFLDGTSVTDVGARTFTELHKLTWMKLGNTAVSENTITFLKSALPNCHINA